MKIVRNWAREWGGDNAARMVAALDPQTVEAVAAVLREIKNRKGLVAKHQAKIDALQDTEAFKVAVDQITRHLEAAKP